jgi:hypothetical protein
VGGLGSTLRGDRRQRAPKLPPSLWNDEIANEKRVLLRKSYS